MAVGIMVALGLAAPAAAWVVTKPARDAVPARVYLVEEVVEQQLPASEALPITAAAMKPIEIEAPEEEAVEPPPPPAKRNLAAVVLAPPAPEPEAEAPKERCYWHRSETLASGSVRVCDVDRTENDLKGERLFEGIEKSMRLAPRDTPSPSGFIR
jgi:hypothetical protein